MTSLGLGDIAAFPFVDAPDSRQIADGVRLLEELEAFETYAAGTPEQAAPGAHGRDEVADAGSRHTGRRWRPWTPAGADAPRGGPQRLHQRGPVIVAALSMQDPRERPADKQTQADQAHARFRDEHSDFVSLLNLWRYLKEQQKVLSGSASAACARASSCTTCVCASGRISTASCARRAASRASTRTRPRPHRARPKMDLIHQSLLAGLLSHIGLRDEVKRDYLGARGARFAISPGSTLFRRQPTWVMSAELVETSRLWARTNAHRPGLGRAAGRAPRQAHLQRAALVEEAGCGAGHRAGHPLRRSLVAARTVQYGRINPEESRDLFIRHALVEGDWETHHEFFRANQALLQRLSELEERARRRDLIVDDDTLVEFYDQRVPADVVSARHFDSWWKKARRETPQLLTFTEDLLTRRPARRSPTDYPPPGGRAASSCR